MRLPPADEWVVITRDIELVDVSTGNGTGVVRVWIRAHATVPWLPGRGGGQVKFTHDWLADALSSLTLVGVGFRVAVLRTGWRLVG